VSKNIEQIKQEMLNDIFEPRAYRPSEKPFPQPVLTIAGESFNLCPHCFGVMDFNDSTRLAMLRGMPETWDDHFRFPIPHMHNGGCPNVIRRRARGAEGVNARRQDESEVMPRGLRESAQRPDRPVLVAVERLTPESVAFALGPQPWTAERIADLFNELLRITR